MDVSSKIYNIQLLKIQPEERLATSSELNPAPILVTGCCEARGIEVLGCNASKGIEPRNTHYLRGDVVHLTEGSSGTWRDDASPTGPEIVARRQRDIMKTREARAPEEPNAGKPHALFCEGSLKPKGG